MTIFHSIILGIIEGATEYLPISSTFHLIWSARLLHIPQTDFSKLFEVFIQAGAIAAVAILYLQAIFKDTKLFTKVVASFIPTAVVGLLLYKIIKNFFFTNSWLQLFVFLAVGLGFILYERFGTHKSNTKDLKSLTYQQAVLVGLAQSLAVVPGVSRAGAVIVALMMLKIRRDEAAKYSFLLAMPTIFAASFLDLFKMRALVLHSAANLDLLLIGTIAAFISAFIVVRWFIKFLQKHTLELFGWYRIAIFILLLVFFGKVL